jgi:hypothetical protein
VPYFGQLYEGDDLGEEGHFPPTLTDVGAKLRADWSAQVITKGSHGGAGVRPYLEVQMPSFPSAVGKRLAVALASADIAKWERTHEPGMEPAFSEELVEAGRTLVGMGGFLCIVCHDVAGKPSLGMPMVDLAQSKSRLRYDWFTEWIEHPTKLRPQTRMASYWTDGMSARTDILGGGADEQIDAIWSYLSLGPAMPLPEGLAADPNAYLLEPGSEPIYHACFLKGASPRAMAVGFEERKHLAFDFENLRLHQMWVGDFVDAAATWQGRAGGDARPAGEMVLSFPAGVAAAVLADPSAAWPQNEGRTEGWRLVGHKKATDGMPTFRYAHGDVLVEESFRPVFGPGGHFLRKFRVTGAGADSWYLRIAAGESVTFSEGVAHVQGDGLITDAIGDVLSVRIPGVALASSASSSEGAMRYTVDPDTGIASAHAIAGDISELLIPVTPNAEGVFEIEVDLQW